ncbi:hypothetical protein JKP88DRAFT_241662 [Tribonema minus]|uniref:Uncharacterized protein n=1 Tax=Tribonema minus TaxID=303371 RepID=A0A835YTQ7_9STRA|nr:hypothetical protein JKP88DRAFT_241662 [Tribonema minus]
MPRIIGLATLAQSTEGGGDEFGHRNRVCRNEDCALAQVAEGGGAVINRDTNARAHLGMHGVYATCGVDDIIPGYPPDQEQGEDTPKRRKATRRTTRRRMARRVVTATRAVMGGRVLSMSERAVVTRRGSTRRGIIMIMMPYWHEEQY